jgi:hypothetical protein
LQREARLARNQRRRHTRKDKTDRSWLTEPVAALHLSAQEGD